MKFTVNDNGVSREPTPEEIEAAKQVQNEASPMTGDGRELAEVKAQLAAMETAYMEGVQEA